MDSQPGALARTRRLLISADRAQWTGPGPDHLRQSPPIRNSSSCRPWAPLRQSRLRTGAIDWALYQDSQNPRLFIELFSVASWEEHLRQHRERQTATDLQYHDEAAALSDPPPQTGHYLAADVHE